VKNYYGTEKRILGPEWAGRSIEKNVYMCPIPKVSGIEQFHVIARIKERQDALRHSDEQHAMSSHESQSALMLTVEFSKMYYTI
jgi:hypothetical protein